MGLRFTKPKQYERTRQLEGIKGTENIWWDIDVYDGIRQEIEQSSPNIRELLSAEKLTAEEKRCTG